MTVRRIVANIHVGVHAGGGSAAGAGGGVVGDSGRQDETGSGGAAGSVALSPEPMAQNREFYGLLGFEEVMDLDWITTLGSPVNPTAQISFVTEEKTAPLVPDLSIEVDDVDAVYEAVRASGADIVRNIGDEDWGVRRFFVRDPNGQVVNVLGHLG